MHENRSVGQGLGYMANLIIAPSAENDLNAIVDYISKELCNPEAADALCENDPRHYTHIQSLKILEELRDVWRSTHA